MSELTTTITQASTAITTPAETVSFEAGTEVQILQIIDTPASKSVEVIVENLGEIKLDSLSDDNYDTPAEWTNADVVAAVKAYIETA